MAYSHTKIGRGLSKPSTHKHRQRLKKSTNKVRRQEERQDPEQASTKTPFKGTSE
jgi:hypothetical protein